MVRRPLSVPCFDKAPCADGEAIVAVVLPMRSTSRGTHSPSVVTNLNPCMRSSAYRKQSDRAMPDTHLHGESASHFPVVHGERSYLRFALGDGYVAGPVVTH